MLEDGGVADLSKRIVSARDGHQRVLVALAGPPGAGKSTLAAALKEAVCAEAGRGSAELVPMDGFHLDNAELHRRGLFAVKGAPETFDAAGFVALVRNARKAVDDLPYPIFDRANDRTLQDAAILKAQTRFVIFEGNYLLLQQGDWAELSGLFDVTVLLTAPISVLRGRLVGRWLKHGLSQRDAEARAEGNDMVNARTVLNASGSAHIRLSTQSDGRISMETHGQRKRRAGWNSTAQAKRDWRSVNT